MQGKEQSCQIFIFFLLQEERNKKEVRNSFSPGWDSYAYISVLNHSWSPSVSLSSDYQHSSASAKIIFIWTGEDFKL